MRVLSLFDGIACLRVALKDKQVDYYGSAEIDVNALAVAMNNWSDITPLGDVCSVKDIKDIDLLCGGSPCTDLSIAKSHREGLKGDRSKLFYEFVRILKETKPRYFLLENVASMKPEDRNEITAQLGVSPIMIDASLVSAQSRKRLFWTNIPVKGLPDDRNLTLQDILESDVAEEYYINSKPVLVKGRRTVGHVGDTNSQANRIYDSAGKSCTLSANGGGLGAKTGLYSVGVSIRAHKIGDEWVDKVEHRKDSKVSALTTTFAGKLALVGELENTEVRRIRKLTPIECERLQGLPDNYTDCLSKTQRYKCLGNAFNTEVIRFILSFMS